MIYQVRADLFFDIDDEAADFYHDCQLALSKATVVNPGQPNQECSHIELIDCHHYLDPNEPCSLVNSDDNSPS